MAGTRKGGSLKRRPTNKPVAKLGHFSNLAVNWVYHFISLLKRVLMLLLFLSQHNDGLPGSVFLLSRSTFSHPSNLLPWRSGNSGSYWKSHRRAPSSESVSGLERLIRACSLSEPSENSTTLHDPYEPLLPLLLGPCVRVWRSCYLRGALHPQVHCHGVHFLDVTRQSYFNVHK